MGDLTKAQRYMLETANGPIGYVVYGEREARTANILLATGMVACGPGHGGGFINGWELTPIFATDKGRAILTQKGE